MSYTIRELREDVRYMKARPAKSLSLSSDQTISDNSATTVTWATTDYQFGENITLSSGVATMPLDGLVLVQAGAAWTSNATGQRRLEVFYEATSVAASQIDAANGRQTWHTVSNTIEVASGDEIYVSVLQDSTGNLDLLSGGRRTFFTLVYLHHFT